MRWPWTKTALENEEQPPEQVIIGASEGNGELDEFSPTWIFIKKYLGEEVQRLRERNDSLALDADKTASIRGQIKAFSRLINLPEELNRKTSLRLSLDDE